MTAAEDLLDSDPRRDEIARALTAVQSRVAAACRRVGRDPGAVTLVVVTKTHPAPDVRRLASLGVVDVAENRDQEAREKAATCADLSLRWHFVGQLQTNKARSVASYADVVHSVDRARVVTALEQGARAASRVLSVLLQVSLDEGRAGTAAAGAGRGGVAPGALLDLAGTVDQASHLRLRGLMGVAPRHGDPRVAFARLAELATMLRVRYPEAGWVSAGMSGDLEAAVMHGATHLRIGSAILGTRRGTD